MQAAIKLKPLSATVIPDEQQTDTTWSVPVASDDYLTMIFESFLGQLFPFQGLLLLNEAGQLIQSNTKARELCQGLNQTTAAVNNAVITLPSQVETLCKFLADGRLEFPGQPLQLREDIFLGTGLRVHIKAEWINLEGQDTPCILVRLEDATQTAGQRALCDAIRYGLTQRETEVWKLYLQGLSYREVGEQLFIALSTVKKHMKNVHGKRRGDIF
ncbi:MAG: helix-turn-helix transcriptional regulator [Cyanobacteria bacterium P01_H01_bin.58]